MIPPGHPTGRIHPLLYHRPIPFRRHDERMKIELKTILHGRIVHFRGKSAAPYQRLPVPTGTFGDVQQFSGSLTGRPAAAAADIDTEFRRPQVHRFFQGIHDRGSNSQMCIRDSGSPFFSPPANPSPTPDGPTACPQSSSSSPSVSLELFSKNILLNVLTIPPVKSLSRSR